mmetsp:Transcript_10009/g.23033  ORF Transcript_10009/g.23033 Transcript_10009/m.23033 type:complete len:144 (-) Transcript_10009:544-975(-)
MAPHWAFGKPGQPSVGPGVGPGEGPELGAGLGPGVGLQEGPEVSVGGAVGAPEGEEVGGVEGRELGPAVVALGAPSRRSKRRADRDDLALPWMDRKTSSSSSPPHSIPSDGRSGKASSAQGVVLLDFGLSGCGSMHEEKAVDL